MKTSPVSFGSLMVIRMNKPGNHLPLKDEVGLSFPDVTGDGGHPKLQDYRLSDTFVYSEKQDGSIWNATKNFAHRLDDEYRRIKGIFKDNPKKVVFTKADFYKNPRETEEKFFLTAASEEDEDKIHKILSQSSRYLVVKWNR